MKSNSRPKRYVETSAYLSMLRRMIVAAGKRVGHADAEDLVELLSIRDELDAAITKAVTGLREDGYTDQSIADALGVSRPAVTQRWPRRP